MTFSFFGYKVSGLNRNKKVWSFLIKIFRGTLLSFQRLFFLILIALGCFYILTFTKQESPLLKRIQSFVFDLTIPIISLLNKPIQWGQSQFEFFSNYKKFQEFIAEYENNKNELYDWKNKALSLNHENEELRKLLNYSLPVNLPFTTLKVLGTAQDQVFSTLFVSIDSSKNIIKDAPVIAPEGVVGRVSEVGFAVARIMLLTDVNSRTPVRIESTGEQAILAGKGDEELMIIHLKKVNEDTEAKPTQHAQIGDRLLTSGFGGIFPPDIPVATITNITDERIYAQLNIDPTKLKFVRIIEPIHAQVTTLQNE